MTVIRLSLILSTFSLGFLLGATTLNVISGIHLDRAELEIHKLHTHLADQAEQIKALEDTLAQRKTATVSKIDIQIIPSNADNEYDKLEIEKTIKQLLRDVRGQEVAALDPVLITKIIDNRIIEISDHRYLVEVKQTLISEKLIMYVKITETTPGHKVP